MARKIEKNAKKIASEIDKGFNRDLQGKNDEKVVYIRNGGDMWARTTDLVIISDAL